MGERGSWDIECVEIKADSKGYFLVIMNSKWCIIPSAMMVGALVDVFYNILYLLLAHDFAANLPSPHLQYKLHLTILYSKIK